MPEEVGAPTKPHQGGKGAIVGGAARLIRNEEEDDGEIGGCLAGAGTAQEGMFGGWDLSKGWRCSKRIQFKWVPGRVDGLWIIDASSLIYNFHSIRYKKTI